MTHDELLNHIKSNGLTLAKTTEYLWSKPKGTKLWFGKIDVNDGYVSSYDGNTNNLNQNFGYEFSYQWDESWKKRYSGQFELVKGFEANKTAKELGIDTSRKFVVVDDEGHSDIKKGDILEFYGDDNTRAPFFNNLTNGRKNFACFWNRLAYVDDVVEETASFNCGHNGTDFPAQEIVNNLSSNQSNQEPKAQKGHNMSVESIIKSVKAKLNKTDRKLAKHGFLNVDGTRTESYEQELLKIAQGKLIEAEDTKEFRSELANSLTDKE